MSADTLTDAEARVLRDATRGRLVFNFRQPDEQRLIPDMKRRGLLDQAPYPGATPAGREALARHEANAVNAANAAANDNEGSGDVRGDE